MKKKMMFKSIFFISLLSVLFILNSGCKKNEAIEGGKEESANENVLPETDSEGTDMSILKTIIHPANYGFDLGWKNGFPKWWYPKPEDDETFESMSHYTGPGHAYALKIKFPGKSGFRQRVWIFSYLNPGFRAKGGLVDVVFQGRRLAWEDGIEVEVSIGLTGFDKNGKPVIEEWCPFDYYLGYNWRTIRAAILLPSNDISCETYEIDVLLTTYDVVDVGIDSFHIEYN